MPTSFNQASDILLGVSSPTAQQADGVTSAYDVLLGGPATTPSTTHLSGSGLEVDRAAQALRSFQGGLKEINSLSSDNELRVIPRALARGALEYGPAMLGGIVGWAGSAADVDPVRQAGLSLYRYSNEKAGKYPSEVQSLVEALTGPNGIKDWKSWEGFDSPGKFLTWIGETFFELLPQMAIVTGAGLAAKAGGVPLGLFAGGSLLMKGSTQVGKSVLDRLIRKEAARIAAASAKTGKRLPAASAMQMAEKSVQEQALFRLGAGVQVFNMYTGSNWAEVVESFGIDNPASAAVSGAGAAMFMLVGGQIQVVEAILGRAGRSGFMKAIATGNKAKVQNIMKNVAEVGGRSMLEEFGQESLALLNYLYNDPSVEQTAEAIFEAYGQNIGRPVGSAITVGIATAPGGGLRAMRQSRTQEVISNPDAILQAHGIDSSGEITGVDTQSSVLKSLSELEAEFEALRDIRDESVIKSVVDVDQAVMGGEFEEHATRVEQYTRDLPERSQRIKREQEIQRRRGEEFADAEAAFQEYQNTPDAILQAHGIDSSGEITGVDTQPSVLKSLSELEAGFEALRDIRDESVIERVVDVDQAVMGGEFEEHATRVEQYTRDLPERSQRIKREQEIQRRRGEEFADAKAAFQEYQNTEETVNEIAQIEQELQTQDRSLVEQEARVRDYLNQRFPKTPAGKQYLTALQEWYRQNPEQASEGTLKAISEVSETTTTPDTTPAVKAQERLKKSREGAAQRAGEVFDIDGTQVRFDGVQKGVGDIKDTYQFTVISDGLSKGVTFHSDSLVHKNLSSMLKEQIGGSKEDLVGAVHALPPKKKATKIKPTEAPEAQEITTVSSDLGVLEKLQIEKRTGIDTPTQRAALADLYEGVDLSDVDTTRGLASESLINTKKGEDRGLSFVKAAVEGDVAAFEQLLEQHVTRSATERSATIQAAINQARTVAREFGIADVFESETVPALKRLARPEPVSQQTTQEGGITSVDIGPYTFAVFPEPGKETKTVQRKNNETGEKKVLSEGKLVSSRAIDQFLKKHLRAAKKETGLPQKEGRSPSRVNAKWIIDEINNLGYKPGSLIAKAKSIAAEREQLRAQTQKTIVRKKKSKPVAPMAESVKVFDLEHVRDFTDVKNEVANTIKENQYTVPIEVVENFFELPPHIGEALESLKSRQATEQGVEPSLVNVKAFYWADEKKVYLIADSLEASDVIKDILRHEVVGHYGLETVLQEAGIPLPTIAKNLEAMAKTDQNLREVIDFIDAGNRALNPRDANSRVKEILAVMAERGHRGNLINQILAAINRFLKRIGLRSQEDFSVNDLYGVLKLAELRSQQRNEKALNRDQTKKAFASFMATATPADIAIDTVKKQALSVEDIQALKSMNISETTTSFHVKRFFQKSGTMMKNMVNSIDFELERIAKNIGQKVNDMEFRINRKNKQYKDLVHPFLRAVNMFDRETGMVLSHHWLNEQWGDIKRILKTKESELKNDHTIKRLFHRRKQDISVDKIMEDLLSVFEDIKKGAEDVGLIYKFWDGYLPRQIRDYDEFLKFTHKMEQKKLSPGEQKEWSPILEAIKQREKENGKPLTPAEKQDVIVRMFERGPDYLMRRPGFSKERSISHVPPSMVHLYATIPETMATFVDQMTEQIEMRKTLGKTPIREQMRHLRKLEVDINKLDKEINQTTDAGPRQDLIVERDRLLTVWEDIDSKKKNAEDALQESIAAMVESEVAPEHQLRVKDILSARFKQRGPSKVIGDVRNVLYMITLGSFNSALTQLGDQAKNVLRFKYDIIPSMWEAASAFMTRTDIVRTQLEMTRAQQDFPTGRLTFYLDRVFRYSGLKGIDLWGKETAIRGFIRKYTKVAQQKDKEKAWAVFSKKWGQGLLGEQSAREAFEDLRAGRDRTEAVLKMVFTGLAEYQPIHMSAMPVGYLQGGNARALYMLKTFSLRVLNGARQEFHYEFKKAEAAKDPVTKAHHVAKGLFKASSTLAAIALAGAGADEIKDWLMGRDESFKETFYDNFTALLLLNRFGIEKGIQSDQVISSIIFGLMPPLRFADDLASDLTAAFKADKEQKAKTIRHLPFLGKIAHARLDVGVEPNLKRRRQEIMEHYSRGDNVTRQLRAHNQRVRETGMTDYLLTQRDLRESKKRREAAK